MDFVDRNGGSRNVWDFESEEKQYSAEEDVKHCNYVEVSSYIYI